jgi:hypothetical protein
MIKLDVLIKTSRTFLLDTDMYFVGVDLGLKLWVIYLR